MTEEGRFRLPEHAVSSAHEPGSWGDVRPLSPDAPIPLETCSRTLSCGPGPPGSL